MVTFIKSFLYVVCTIELGVILSLAYIPFAHANTINPCEYVNITANNAEHLNTGDDPNFIRIMQQNNRNMILACQEYQIKLYEQRKADLNRDNY